MVDNRLLFINLMFYFVQIAEKLKFIDESEDFSTIKQYTEPLVLIYV